ncbi:acyltransferase family protein [Buchananella felis]|uniref:acyltransferase family protein n=1 Tax=Buchananella felis TaxID=3231492 RepID=UPI003528F8CD
MSDSSLPQPGAPAQPQLLAAERAGGANGAGGGDSAAGVSGAGAGRAGGVESDAGARARVPARRSRRRQPSAMRGDIQALRALAVLFVIAVHLWPTRLPGGFVGVDVFFVISGFLITSHLGKELFSTGRVRFGLFYARRMKRLLPAAFLVIVTSMVAVVAISPWDAWERNMRELMASVAYVQNLYLTAEAVNYHAQAHGATVAQHYWSLSVEEQFYALWPLLLAGLTWAFLGRRGRADVAAQAATLRRRLGVAIALFTAAFFAFNLWFTHVDVNRAYFFTPVRFWEFGIGALVAFTVHLAGRVALPARLALAVAGWAGLVAAGVLISPQDPFPGWRALVPTAATGLVIFAGGAGDLPGLRRLTDLRPVRWVGDVSYSLYLWHWPFIVLLPHATGHHLTRTDKLGILAATFVLAGLTYHLVENPGRRLGTTTGWTIVATLTAMAMLLSSGWLAIGHARTAMAAQAQRQAELLTQDCAGPNALLVPACAEHRDDPLFSDSLGAEADYFTAPPACVTLSEESGSMPAVVECDHSGGDPDAPLVYLLGDSHAEQWRWSIDLIAQRRGWKLRSILKGGFPFGAIPAGPDGQLADDWAGNIQRSVEEHLLAERPDRVIQTAYALGHPVDDGTGRSEQEMYADGLARFWRELTARGIAVDVIADIPLNQAVRPVECVSANADQPGKCARPRAAAIPSAPLNFAVERFNDPGVRLVDLTGAFCDAENCYAAVGGVQIYFDHDHMQRQYSILLSEELEAALER